MNVSDRRLINGPANVHKLVFETEEKPVAPEITNDITPVFITRGIASNCNGSALLESGDIIILCTVYGAKPIHGSFAERVNFQVNVKYLPFINKPIAGEVKHKLRAGQKILADDSSIANAATGSGSAAEKEMASFIQSALEPAILGSKYKKSSIEVFLTVVSGSGNSSQPNSAFAATIAQAVNVSSLALVDAGVECLEMVSGAAVRLIESNGKKEVFGDPRAVIGENVKVSDSVITFMNGRNDGITGLWTVNPLSFIRETNLLAIDNEFLDLVISKATELSRGYRQVLNKCLVESVQ